MNVWFVDQASTDGYMCTEGPFISDEYVIKSKEWLYSELDWQKAHDFHDEEMIFYAEHNDSDVITGYRLYPVHVEGTDY